MKFVSTLQSRLAMKQDNLRRKLIDGTVIKHISSPVDCIRLKKKTNYKGDDIYWDCESADVISAVFPPLEDVPFRKVQVDEGTGGWKLTSLVNAFEDGEQEKAYTLQVPYEHKIDVDDLIFRIFIDEEQDFLSIVPIQVTELLGTFGGMKLIMQKCKCVIPTIDIPQEVVDVVQQMAVRRLAVGY